MTELPKRKYNRLEGYDYSLNGAYFVTVCAKDRQDLFAKYDVGAATCRPQNNNDDECYGKRVDNPNIELSDIGHLIDIPINNIPKIYQGVFIDKYIIMPDHVHMIIVFDRDTNEKDGRQVAAPTTTLQTIIQHMKRDVSKRCRQTVWQKSFFDHIIRHEEDYYMIIGYIENNPKKLEMDIEERENGE